MGRRSERDLSLEEMKSAVLEHGRRIQQRRGEHGGFVYEFQKIIRGKLRSVIAEVKKAECWLITVIPPDEEE